MQMWDLRADVSGCDAAYFALAESFDGPLLTADARLSRMSASRCEVRVVVSG